MDKMELKKTQKYECENCDFFTSNKYDYERHCQTRKHNFLKNGTFGNAENARPFMCLECDKTFLTAAGLWKHNQKCPKKCPKPEKCPKQETQPLLEFMQFIIKRDEERDQKRDEFELKRQEIEQKKDELNKQREDKRDEMIMKMVTEVCKNTQLPAAQTINNTMNNSNNVITDSFNTFNLNLFLNETCKDAVNLSDFIENIKIEMEEMERIGQIGYVNGLSAVINQNLNLLGIEKRPIHCTDAKRQVLYIKNDNEWTKEDKGMPRLQRLIDEVQKANLRLLQVWKMKHPGCLTSNSMYTDCYNNLSQELMGGFCNKVSLIKKDEKIRNLIIKDVTIDKQAHLNFFCSKKA